jgi:hypothetical protein
MISETGWVTVSLSLSVSCSGGKVGFRCVDLQVGMREGGRLNRLAREKDVLKPPRGGLQFVWRVGYLLKTDGSSRRGTVRQSLNGWRHRKGDDE